jgi:hypothetical protein
VVLTLLFLAGVCAPACAQEAAGGLPAGTSDQQLSSGSSGAATGPGIGPQVTCFGGPTVLTCLDNAGGPPFQVNCFGASLYRTCISFEGNKQFTASGLGGGTVNSGPGSDPAAKPPAATNSGSAPAPAGANP